MRGPDKASKPAGGNRERIIRCSIELFNEQGVQSVTIEQICAELQISPGNLTYHFKRKNDLIRSTLAVIKQQMLLALKRPEGVSTAQDGAEFVVDMLRSFWEARFFFNGLAYLLTDDEQMRQDYEDLRSGLVDMIDIDMRYLASKGVLITPTPPNHFLLLAENIWSLLLNWLRVQQTVSPTARTVPDNGLFDMALHLWSMSQPWMEPRFAKRLLKAIEALLQMKAPRRRASRSIRKMA